MKTKSNIKPILFSSPMVQAILRGEKTQTRRIMKEQPPCQLLSCGTSGRYWADNPEDLRAKYFRCKYEIGTILWVRETWRKANGMPTGYRYEWKATALEDGNPIDEPWKPSIYMPKDACRIFLMINKIRIQRVQDISENDSICEGVQELEKGHSWLDYEDKTNDYGCGSAKASYRTLWCKINGKESWDNNPYVFVYDFQILHFDDDLRNF
jgi:hypothetical protein